ncbi:hypothetical protein PXH66_04525 [Synoicihabitans lomoniglobus]|uniref:Uncharacterized protein n=2 Tax=Synoicihabitans lomoniglobus TaxID=2909285 RepID=A0AAF0CQB5_9BACT|nr:hypothetical protein PXH66_04525 [Opitutaceae bacterium LMO-M01]
MALLGATASLQAADVPVSGSITSNTTWTADNTYIMSGYVFVTNGATLTIEPGTVVKGQVSSGAGAAALIVTRSSKIMAEGTADQPIIFTSVLDNLDGSLGTERKGLWGGVILLGNAQINSRADGEDPGSPKQDQIEGVSVTTEQIPLVTFGGLDDADNSGVMKYVSIRHGGANLGAGNEINGLTLGGVGSGTVLSYIEVYANFDDGFEFFGGTVSPDHLVAAFCGDDSFDFDSGFRGTLQWLFTLQAVDGEEPGDKAIEWDGDTNPPTGTPVSSVTVSNLTAIGLGSTGGANAPINPRDNATVKLYNSAFINYARGIEIESDIGDVAPDIQSNVWWSHVAATNTAAGFGTSNSSGDLDATSYFTNAALNNVIVAPMMNGISYAKDAGLDPRPSSAESPLMTTPVFAADGLTATDYVGAFGTDLWIKGWTNLDIAGFLPAVLAAPDDAENADFVAPIVRGSTSKPSNVSTRGFVGTGLQSLTGGFVISGTQSQSVVIRAVGPTLGLAPFNLPGTLANVQIRLFSTSDPINPIAVSRVVTTQSITLGAELGAFALSAGAEDATIVATLAPGGYTAEVTGVDGATGIAIIEVYELD